MFDGPQGIWWVFILGALVSLILLLAVVGSLVLSHRRYANLHRSHARRVLDAQEKERAWVSREVHDDAVQRLVLISRGCGDASRAVAELAPEQANRLRALQTEVSDLSVFLRGVAHRLHPALIDRGGLRAALSGLGEELERGYGVRVELQLPLSDARLAVSPEQALVVYRIAQEALHNVAKHAAVGSARLELATSAAGIELCVSDRGRGFDPGLLSDPNGIGLISIRERAYLAEGEVEITSQPGVGTVVRAFFPPGGRSRA